MKYTITLLALLFSVSCIPYAVLTPQFYARKELFFFGVGSLVIFLLIMAYDTIQKQKVLKQLAQNDINY